MELHRMWTEQCNATTGIRQAFGAQQALNYLIGEKFLDFIEAAGKDENFRDELPVFVARVKTLFEPAELAAYLAPVDESEVVRDVSIVHCASDGKLLAIAWKQLQSLR
jgi:hypothetical protein